MTSHFQTGAWVELLLYAIALLVGITHMYMWGRTTRPGGGYPGSAWGLLGALVDGYFQNGSA